MPPVMCNLDMFQLLLEHPSAANLPGHLNSTHDWLERPFYFWNSANEYQNTAMVQFLLERFDNWTDLDVFRALCLTCYKGNLKTVLLILRYRPNISLRESFPNTHLPLHAACINRNVVLIGVLLAQPTVSLVGNKEIYAAIDADSVQMLQLLLN